MIDAKPRYYGDQRMLTKLDDLEVLSYRLKGLLRDNNIIFLADLLQRTGQDLSRLPNFRGKPLDEIKSYLASLSYNNIVYELGAIDIIGEGFNGDEEKIKKYFGLREPKQKPMQGFAATDFEIVGVGAEGGEIIVKIKMPEGLALAIQHGLVIADEDSPLLDTDFETQVSNEFRRITESLGFMVDPDNSAIMHVFYDPNHYTDIVSKVNKTWLCQAFERGCKMLTSKAHERACIIYGFDRLNSNTGPT